VTIITWGGETDGRNGSAATFASIRSTREKLASDPKLNLRLEPVPDTGEEAFLDVSSSTIAVRVRKADLIYVVSLDVYSPQSQPNAVALAAQVAKRWKAGVGMVEGRRPSRQTAASISQPTRASLPSLPPISGRMLRSARARRRPRRLQRHENRAAAQDHGTDQRESRIDRVEDLPKPIRCLYQTSRADLVQWGAPVCDP